MINELIITLNLLAAVLTLFYIGRLVTQARHDEELPLQHSYVKRSLLNQHIERRRA